MHHELHIMHHLGKKLRVVCMLRSVSTSRWLDNSLIHKGQAPHRTDRVISHEILQVAVGHICVVASMASPFRRETYKSMYISTSRSWIKQGTLDRAVSRGERCKTKEGKGQRNHESLRGFHVRRENRRERVMYMDEWVPMHSVSRTSSCITTYTTILTTFLACFV